MHQQEPIGYGLLASVNSSCAQPLPSPRLELTPRNYSGGREHLSCLMPGGGDESRGQMPSPRDRSNQPCNRFLFITSQITAVFSVFLSSPRSLLAFCTFFSIRFPHHGTGYQPFKASFHFRTCAVDRFYSRTSQTNTVIFITIFEFLVFI